MNFVQYDMAPCIFFKQVYLYSPPFIFSIILESARELYVATYLHAHFLSTLP